MPTVTKVITALSKTERSDLLQVKSALSARFLRAAAPAVAVGARALREATDLGPRQNVVGVGIDEKYVAGIPTGVPVVKFLVRSKVGPSALSRREMLPTKVDGFETDVEETGPIVPQAKTRRQRTTGGASAAAIPNPRTRMRPAQPGSSIGFREPNDAFLMAGTFGLLVKDTRGKKYILSNNHVIAYENGLRTDGTRRTALRADAPIFQPGLLDRGDIDTDKIAELTRWVNLRADREDNAVDGAIAILTPQSAANRNILFIGAPSGTADARRDMVVHKFGRTTSYRAGRVSSVSFDVLVPYEVGDVMFADQIAIRGLNGQRFSDSGDSGSGILERDTNAVVGLLFAGATNGSLTFANHISDVFQRLRVKLV
ncbi:MAG: hypothetical protein ACREIT_11010 [Tepidisphaeraceae bacterium]